MGPLKRLAMRLCKIPPDPSPPAGSEASIQVFRAAPNYFRLALLRWFFRQLAVAFGFLFFFAFIGPVLIGVEGALAGFINVLFENMPEFLQNLFERLRVVERAPLTEDPTGPQGTSFLPLFTLLEILAIVFYLVQLPLSYAIVRLDYELRWYIVTDRSLRIREGVVAIHETTMTFANVQNLAIRQGPLQRLLGIADLKVRTAGGGGTAPEGHTDPRGESLHTGYFHGVDNAEEIRDTILRRLRSLKGSGLGEPDDLVPSAAHTDAETGTVSAAIRLLGEVRQLRRHLESG